MDFSIKLDQLEQFHGRLNNATTEAEIRELKNLIQRSFQNLINIIKEEDQPKQNLVNISSICLEKIQRAQDVPPTDIYMRNLITLASLATFSSQDYELFEQYQNLSPSILIYYNSDFLKHDEYGNMITPNDTNQFIATLLQAQMCNQTFVFMEEIYKKSDESDQLIDSFLPLIRSGLPNYIEPILSFFECVMSSESEDDFLFSKEFISILTDFSEQIHDTKQICFIWSGTIDKSFDFFLNPIVGNDFTTTIFNKFQRILLRLLDEDIESFNSLYNIYSTCVKYVQDEVENEAKPFIEDFLFFTIELLENHPNLYQSKDTLESLNYFFTINGNEDFFKRLLNEFWSKMTFNLSKAYLYLFTYADNFAKSYFSNSIASQIIESNNPHLISFFITNFIQYAPRFVEQLVSICFSRFGEFDKKDFGDAISKFAIFYPYSIKNEMDSNFQSFIEFVEESDIEISTPYLICLFVYMKQVQENNVDFDKIGNIFINKIIVPISNEKILEKDSYLINNIIQCISPGDNEQLISFLNGLFDHIISLISPLMMSEEENIYSFIYKIITNGLKSNWIRDRRILFEWFQDIMIRNPNPKQFSVLIELTEFLPTNEFIQFLSRTEGRSHIFLMEEIEFLKNAFKLNRNFMIQFPLQPLISFLNFVDTNTTLTVLKMVINCEERNFTQSDINGIIEETLKNGFYSINDRESAIDLIKLIAKKYTGVDEMLQIVRDFQSSDVPYSLIEYSLREIQTD